jgi:hypothetical protein
VYIFSLRSGGHCTHLNLRRHGGTGTALEKSKTWQTVGKGSGRLLLICSVLHNLRHERTVASASPLYLLINCMYKQVPFGKSVEFALMQSAQRSGSTTCQLRGGAKSNVINKAPGGQKRPFLGIRRGRRERLKRVRRPLPDIWHRYEPLRHIDTCSTWLRHRHRPQ